MMRGCVLGIDYSVTCPAVCSYTESATEWWVNYKLHGKPYRNIPSVHWSPSTVSGDLPRFLELTQWVLDIVTTAAPICIVLEDYAFGASGRLTQLSENMGILKSRLYEQFLHIPLHVIAPTTMKKFATGKGNATKDDVCAFFVQQEPRAAEWAKVCHPKAKKITSPMADIADSYFLALYGYRHFLS